VLWCDEAVPAGHSLQVLAPSLLYVPGLQSVQLVPPDADENVPPGQSWHATEPVCAAICPAGQLKQAEKPL